MPKRIETNRTQYSPQFIAELEAWARSPETLAKIQKLEQEVEAENRKLEKASRVKPEDLRRPIR